MHTRLTRARARARAPAEGGARARDSPIPPARPARHSQLTSASAARVCGPGCARTSQLYSSMDKTHNPIGSTVCAVPQPSHARGTNEAYMAGPMPFVLTRMISHGTIHTASLIGSNCSYCTTSSAPDMYTTGERTCAGAASGDGAAVR